MNLPFTARSRDRTERVIAAARVALAVSSLFAIWMDPAEPARFVRLTYSVHLVYVGYSLAIAGLILTRPVGERQPYVMHGIDIVLFSVFQYLTLGPSSPFFVYFIFSLFCGAMRWGWRGTLGTAAVVIFAFLGMAASMSRTFGPLEFEVNRFIIRIVYLAVTAALLVYLGRYEERLRGEIERLARWPTASGANVEHVTGQILEHAARIVGANRAVLVWDAGEEPTVFLAVWSPQGLTVTRHAPDKLKPIVSGALEASTFVWTVAPATISSHLNRAIVPHVAGQGLASAPFQTDRVSGRVFFTELGDPNVEIEPLTEVVAREIGASLDQLHVTKQLQEIAAGEQRIRVARDLHDGVLQSLTGIRLEIRAVAVLDGMASAMRDRLFALERALAIEQRELRFFIAELGPNVRGRNDSPLASKLHALRERIALEWKAPVTIRVDRSAGEVPEHIEQAVPLMVHEAVVNALKHGQPSRVTVTVEGGAHDIRIVVSDDGHGFPFRGRFDHERLVAGRTGPKSLLDRVTELGGQLSIESTDAGARVEMRLSI